MIPLLSVTSSLDDLSHLAASSPALRGASPDVLPPAALCGHPVAAASPIEVHAIDCSRCLDRAPMFMALPAFTHPSPTRTPVQQALSTDPTTGDKH